MKALATFLKVIAATCIVAVLFAMIYGIVYFTNGFTTDFKSFYLKYEDNIVKNDGKLSLNENTANTFYVYYMFDKASSNNDYFVELIKTGNFEFKVDDKPMNWNGELDISSFYELDKKEKSFDLTVDFDIEKCLQKVFDGKKVEIDKNANLDCEKNSYFKLIVKSYNQKMTYTFDLYKHIVPKNITLPNQNIVF